MAFYKYPRTPHLGSKSDIVDDDQRVSARDLLASTETDSPSVTIVVQEKVDGTNVSVHFEQEWQAVAQKRSGLLETGEAKQYQMFRDWVSCNLERLFTVCGTEFCLFGEWLWCEHGLHYDSLPSFFLAFDLLHKPSGRFVSHTRFLAMTSAAGIHSVPVLVKKDIERSQLSRCLEETAESAMAASRFSSSGTVAEGVYVRVEDAEWVLQRAKMRRNTFTCGREDFGRVVRNNGLAAGADAFA